MDEGEELDDVAGAPAAEGGTCGAVVVDMDDVATAPEAVVVPLCDGVVDDIEAEDEPAVGETLLTLVDKDVPAPVVDEDVCVIAVGADVEEAVDVDADAKLSAPNGAAKLTASTATLHGRVFTKTLPLRRQMAETAREDPT